MKITIDSGPSIDVEGELATSILAALDAWKLAEGALSASVRERIKAIERLIATQQEPVAAQAQDAPHVPGVQVQAIRDRMGLTQAELASRLGVAPRTIRAWEKDGIKSVHLAKYLALVHLIEDLKVQLATRTLSLSDE